MLLALTRDRSGRTWRLAGTCVACGAATSNRAVVPDPLTGSLRPHAVSCLYPPARWLVNMQQALGITEARVEPAAESEGAAVPSPRRKAGAARGARKSTAAPGRAATKKPAAKTADAARAAQPTLVELIRRHLFELKEPRSAAEISAALGHAHPERQITTKVVRVTLEGLVAKSQAERTRQGRSVFYIAPVPEPTNASEAETRPEDADR